MEDLYSENYQIPLKEIKEELKKNGKTFHVRGLEDIIP